MQQELISDNSAYTSLSPDMQRTSRARYGVVAFGLLAAGAGIGFLGSSSPGLMAKSRTQLSGDACHPWDGQTKKIFVNGDDNEDLEMWLSHNDDGHWLIARYSGLSDAAPFFFRAGDNCHEYYLRDDWPGLSKVSASDAHWVSFTSAGQWVRAVYQSRDAVPIQFIPMNDGTYKMKNKFDVASDLGGHDSDHLYFSYTAGNYVANGYTHPTRSVRTVYTEHDAMRVSVTDACHPWAGQTKNIFVNGDDNEDLEMWLSHNDDGHWLIARYGKVSDAAPFFFREADNCHEYYLRDDWPGLSKLSASDAHWVSFTSAGQWVRAVYQSRDAVPIQFIPLNDGTYKMKNKFDVASDLGGHDSDHLYFSYTAGNYAANGYTHPLHSVRTVYTEHDAMIVSVTGV